MGKKDKQINKDFIHDQQKNIFSPIKSKKRKKNIGDNNERNKSRSTATKQRNRQNAELDRFKRRILSQYTRSLPILVQQIQDQHQSSIKRCAMDQALKKFIKFHNTHIVQKGETFTINSIRPELRIKFQNFVNNLLEYSLKQLSDLDQKDLLSHQNKILKNQFGEEEVSEQKQSTGDIEMVNEGKEVDCSGLRVVHQTQYLRRITMKSSNFKMKYSLFTFLLIGIVLCSIRDHGPHHNANHRLLFRQELEQSSIANTNEQESGNYQNKKDHLNFKDNHLVQSHKNYNLQKQQYQSWTQLDKDSKNSYYKDHTKLPEQIAPQCFNISISYLFVTCFALIVTSLLFICVCNLEKTWKKFKASIIKSSQEEVMV